MLVLAEQNSHTNSLLVQFLSAGQAPSSGSLILCIENGAHTCIGADYRSPLAELCFARLWVGCCSKRD